MELPYIAEAHVLPVLDYEAQGLAAALVRLQKTDSAEDMRLEVNLLKIRQDLSSKMELYKLPALLRILHNKEELPMTSSGKLLKPQALEKFFHLDGYRPRDYAVEGVEFWGNEVEISSNRRPWDLEGHY
jgi:malonyl-CoA/methylmalonyl-CoA synthetase